MFQAFLIKYGEIGIKGKNRYLFEDALVNQIKHTLKGVEGSFKVTKEQGRIYIEALEAYDFQDAGEVLGKACFNQVFQSIGLGIEVEILIPTQDWQLELIPDNLANDDEIDMDFNLIDINTGSIISLN